MSYGITTSSEIASEVDVFYDKTLIDPLRSSLVYAKYGQKKTVKENDTIKFESYPDLGTRPVALSEGVNPAPQQLSKSYVTAQVSLYGGYVEITEDVDVYTINQPTAIAQERVSRQAVETLDELTRNVIHGGDNVMYADSVAARSDIVTKITEADLRKLARAMIANKAPFFKQMINGSTGVGTSPIPASYLMFVSGEVYYDAEQLTGFKAAHEYASTGQTEDQEVGSVGKFRLILANNAPEVEGGGGAVGLTGLGHTSDVVDVHKCLAISPDAFGNVDCDGGIKTIRKGKNEVGGPLELTQTAGWKSRYTAVILDQAKMYRYECGASA